MSDVYLITDYAAYAGSNKTKNHLNQDGLFLTWSGCVSCLHACLGARLLPQSYQYPNLSEGADRVAGQLPRDKECPFIGITQSGRVWRKVPESNAQRVMWCMNLTKVRPFIWNCVWMGVMQTYNGTIVNCIKECDNVGGCLFLKCNSTFVNCIKECDNTGVYCAEIWVWQCGCVLCRGMTASSSAASRVWQCVCVCCTEVQQQLCDNIGVCCAEVWRHLCDNVCVCVCVCVVQRYDGTFVCVLCRGMTAPLWRCVCVVQRYDGTFVNCIKECDKSAQKLLQIVLREFPAYRDIVTYNGKQRECLGDISVTHNDISMRCCHLQWHFCHLQWHFYVMLSPTVTFLHDVVTCKWHFCIMSPMLLYNVTYKWHFLYDVITYKWHFYMMLSTTSHIYYMMLSPTSDIILSPTSDISIWCHLQVTFLYDVTYKWHFYMILSPTSDISTWCFHLQVTFST